MIYTVTLNPAWDERVYVDNADRVVRTQGSAGGKGINVARVLTALGAECRAVAWVAGPTGEKLSATLDSEGIACRLFKGQGETRTNVKRIRLLTGETAETNVRGDMQRRALAERMIDWLIDAVRPGDIVTLNGSLAPGLAESTYFTAIAWLKRCGVVTVLDAAGRPLTYGAKASPTLIKPNYDEFCGWCRTTFDNDRDFHKAVLRTAAETGSNVLVSRSDREAVLTYAGKLYAVQPSAVRPTQTTGAGDALLAGFLAGCLRGLEAPDAFRAGMAVAERFIAGDALDPDVFTRDRTALPPLRAI